MAEVTALHGGTVKGSMSQPIPEIVDMAERLLEAAKSGEVVGIAACMTHRDDCTSYEITGLVQCRGLLGTLAMAQHEITAKMVEEG
jgi:hypothetical protein